MEAEARKVGKYIEKLSEEVSRFRRTGELSGEFVENPERVLGVIGSLSLHQLMEASLFTFILFVVSGQGSGKAEMAEELRKSLLIYVDQLESLLEFYRQELESLQPEGVG